MAENSDKKVRVIHGRLLYLIFYVNNQRNMAILCLVLLSIDMIFRAKQKSTVLLM